MGERRYVILKWRDDYVLEGLPTVTESELKRRITMILNHVGFHSVADDVDVHTLLYGRPEPKPDLHGEGENQHDLPGCEGE